MLMYKRRRQQEEHTADRWLASYADFITLLFAFFVVMYGISNVNLSKYQQLSQVLGKAFKDTQATTENQTVITAKNPADSPFVQRLNKALDERFSDLVLNGAISLKSNSHWMEISLNAETLFVPGEAELNQKAQVILTQLSDVLITIPQLLIIEGHTDNKPISTLKFPSNWELSAARATTVARELMAKGIDPQRLIPLGYAAEYPLANNKTQVGRQQNRRVVILIPWDEAIAKILLPTQRHPSLRVDHTYESVPIVEEVRNKKSGGLIFRRGTIKRKKIVSE